MIINIGMEQANLENLENRLAVLLDETSREVAHAECFDSEQRSEIYTILEILKSDVNMHRKIIGKYVSDRGD